MTNEDIECTKNGTAIIMYFRGKKYGVVYEEPIKVSQAKMLCDKMKDRIIYDIEAETI